VATDTTTKSRQNRHQRRTTARLQRGGRMDRADLVSIANALIEADATATGATLVLPDGETIYLSADLLRRGGSA
jgi:hypothetical protein